MADCGTGLRDGQQLLPRELLVPMPAATTGLRFSGGAGGLLPLRRHSQHLLTAKQSLGSPAHSQPERTGTAMPEALRNSPLLAVPTERGLEEGASDSQGDAGWRTRVCRVTSRSSFVGRQHASTRGRVSGCNRRTPVTGMGVWVHEKRVRVWCVRTTAVSFCGSCSENGIQLGMW